jgi:inhibitor of KinA sporulation pathway (predicted exonuclease)
MARKVIDIIYNLVRKRLAVFNTKASGSGITRIPTDRQIKKSMQDVFQTLKDGGYNVVSAEKVIQNEDDLARVLTEIQQKQIADAAARKKASEGLERILDKMDRNIPLNPSDQISLEGSGFKTTKDAFKGFEPKVIPGGKKPRDKKSKGGITAAVKKLQKKFGKDIIQKGKAPKKSEKKKLQDLFREFNRKNKAGGGLAYMLGEPRENFGDGGMSRRTFLKIMAALAAFPVVGKLTKMTKVAKGTAPLVTKTSEMPEHFPKLVEKILREGTVVDSQFVKKTGNVKTYRHPDRPDMELTIEGDGQRIQLDFETDQGMRGGYEFKKGIPDETVRKPPDEFESGEVKYRMSPDGDYSKDFELGIDTGTENLDEFVGIKKQKTSKSKVNLPESLDDDFAEGGLAGLLGE